MHLSLNTEGKVQHTSECTLHNAHFTTHTSQCISTIPMFAFPKNCTMYTILLKRGVRESTCQAGFVCVFQVCRLINNLTHTCNKACRHFTEV